MEGVLVGMFVWCVGASGCFVWLAHLVDCFHGRCLRHSLWSCGRYDGHHQHERASTDRSSLRPGGHRDNLRVHRGHGDHVAVTGAIRHVESAAQ